MPTLSEQELTALLEPYLSWEDGTQKTASTLIPKLSVYLDLLMKWNARTNLSAIRDPKAVVVRHFGESLFAGRCLSGYVPVEASVLDLGSGAGFPGLPIQLLHPSFQVTLAESQGKKAAFLREAVRVLELTTEVWAGRGEDLDPLRSFDAVTLRAVDHMDAMREVGRRRVLRGGVLLELSGASGETPERFAIPGRASSFVTISKH